MVSGQRRDRILLLLVCDGATAQRPGVPVPKPPTGSSGAQWWREGRGHLKHKVLRKGPSGGGFKV